MGKRIAVIGAGPMGLAVAYQLVKDGHLPTVFEFDDRIGGMAASFDFDGLEIERFYHFHCTSDVSFEKVLGELDLTTKLKWVKTKMGNWYLGVLQPWGTPLALLQFRGLSLHAKIRYGLHIYFSVKRNKWERLDKIDAASWIRRWVGKEAFEMLWRDLFAYKFYHLADNISAAWIWSRIRRVGRSRYSIFSEKLGYLEGGSQTLLNAMAHQIEMNGGEIVLNARVQRILVEDNAVIGVNVNGGFHIFDKVISTIPVQFLPDIVPELPEQIRKDLRSIENIAVVCVVAKLRNPVTPYFWINTNDPSMDMPGFIEYSNLQKLDSTVVYVPFYLPQTHPTYLEEDSAFELKVKTYLKTINPTLIEEDFLAIRVNRYKYAQPICQPGHLSKLPPIDLPIEGLWAADTSYYYPEDRGISESLALGQQIALAASVSD